MTNGSVVSGLPLLIVKGKFVNIDVMSLPEFKIFIPFMIKCSINRAKAKLNNNIPVWWPQNVSYKSPLKKPNGLSETGWKMHLRNLVIRCYFFHKAQYLLTFCGKIASEPDAFILKWNKDKKTIALYLKHHPSPVLTFDSENMTYDKLTIKTEKVNNRRSLLPLSPVKKCTIIDVYLCENCDAEFSSQNDMIKHEEECFGSKQIDNLTNEETKCSKDINGLIDETNQIQFLNYFNLSCSKSNSKADTLSPVTSSQSKRWVNVNDCLAKNRFIEFSSIRGKKLLEQNVKRDNISVQKAEKLISSYEFHCCTNTTIKPYSMRTDNFKNPKVLRHKHKISDCSRTYSFNKKQRQERCLSILTGLNSASRLLKKNCKNCYVLLSRLDEVTIRSFTKTETDTSNQVNLNNNSISFSAITEDKENLSYKMDVSHLDSYCRPIFINNNNNVNIVSNVENRSKSVHDEDIIDLCSSEEEL